MHGLEHEWQNKVQFLHVNFRTPLGKELGRRYAIEHLPALVVIDGNGQVCKTLGMGLRLRAEVEVELRSLAGGN